MRVRPAAALLLLLGLALLQAAPAAASDKPLKKDFALIFGTVYTPQGRSAVGVKVRVQREGDKKPKWQLVSDRRGEFALRVPAGKADYLVWADRKGKRVADTKVHVEYDERVDIGLHLTE